MGENTTEVLVGSAVLAGAAAFLIYAGQITGFRAASGESNSYFASFRSAQGVSVGTDVRLAGVKVGSVTELKLDPETFRAIARFSIGKDIVLPDDSAAIIATEGLLGGSFIEIQPGGSMFNLEPGAEIEDTQGAVNIVDLMVKFATSGGGGSGAESGGEGG